jgi:hypothetical protein
MAAVALSCLILPARALAGTQGDRSHVPSSGGVSEGTSAPEEGTAKALLTTYTRFAAQSDTAGWRGLFRAVPDSVAPADSGFIRAALDSIEGIHSSSLDRTDCDRWQMWQLARCKMELASADYDGAVLRHTALIDERLSCFDSQSFWWSLVESRMEQLERARRFDDVLALIESAERTFPSGPARFMRGWASRIRYSLGLTEWEKESEGVMRARISELSGIASVAWEFAAHGGRVDTIFVSSATVLRAGGRIWTPGGLRHCFDLADEPTLVPTESDSGRLTGCTLEPGDSVRVCLSAGGSPVLIEILGK